MAKHKKKNSNYKQVDITTENTAVKESSDDKSVKIMRIVIGILLVFAILMALVVFIPTQGSLTSELTGNDFNGEGNAMRVRVDINNDTNKPAFNVKYEIIVTATDGTVLGTKTGTIWMMLPGGTRHLEKYLYFDQAVDTGDVEVNVNGLIIGD